MNARCSFLVAILFLAATGCFSIALVSWSVDYHRAHVHPSSVMPSDLR